MLLRFAAWGWRRRGLRLGDVGPVRPCLGVQPFFFVRPTLRGWNTPSCCCAWRLAWFRCGSAACRQCLYFRLWYNWYSSRVGLWACRVYRRNVGETIATNFSSRIANTLSIRSFYPHSTHKELLTIRISLPRLFYNTIVWWSCWRYSAKHNIMIIWTLKWNLCIRSTSLYASSCMLANSSIVIVNC